jgi:hypothetical protein
MFVNVTKAGNPVTLLLNGVANNLSITYPQQVNASGNSGLGIKLYRNGTDVTTENGLNVSLTAGYYAYLVNATGNANYSANSTGVTYYVNLSKATPVLTMLANGGTSNLTVTYPQQINVSAYSSISLSIGLDRDNVNASGENGKNVSLSAGSYIYRANITGNANYSNVPYKYMNITINKASQTAILNINESSPIIYGKYINVTCNGELYRDSSNVTTEKGISILLGGGSYLYSCQLYSSQNYSYDDDNSTFVVNRATGQITLKLNGVENNLTIGWGNQTNASSISSSGQTVTLYRDSVNKTSENSLNLSLSAGYYNYTAIASLNQNYSESTITRWLNITKVGSLVYAYINNSRANFSAIDGTANKNIWINGTLITGSGNIELYINGILYNNGTSPISNKTNLSIGNYNVTSRYLGNINYTSSIEVWWISVNSTANDTISPEINITSPINGYNVPNYVSGSVPIVSNIYANDTNLASCWYEIRGSQVISNTSFPCINGNNSLTISLSTAGSFIFLVYANDTVGNSSSSNISLSISAYTGSQSGGNNQVGYQSQVNTTKINLTTLNKNKLCGIIQNFSVDHSLNFSNYTSQERDSLRNNLAISLGIGISNIALKHYVENFTSECPDYIEKVPEVPVITEKKKPDSFWLIFLMISLLALIFMIIIIKAVTRSLIEKDKEKRNG